jgi:UBA/TS-N domain
MGFTETEARLALRACNGNVQSAVARIVQRREVSGSVILVFHGVV